MDPSSKYYVNPNKIFKVPIDPPPNNTRAYYYVSNLNYLCINVIENNYDEVKYVLENNICNINHKTKEGFSAIIFAILAKNVSMFEILLKYGSDPNVRDIDGMTPLIHLIDRSQRLRKDPCTEYMFKKLLEAGADPNLETIYKDTILTYLAPCDCESCHNIIKILLREGANIDIRNYFGVSALIAAELHRAKKKM